MPSRSPPAPIAGHAVWQSCGRSRRHSAQRPHDGAHESATWSPTATRVTPSPTASTTPAPSWPSTAGHGVSAVPSIAFWSEWQTPLAARRTSTSPGSGGASSTPGRRAARRSARGPRRGSSSSGADLVGALELAQLVDRDVAAHHVAGLDLDEWRLLHLADGAELAVAAGVEHAAATAGRPRSGSRPRAGSASRPPPSTVGTAESSASVYGWCGPSNTTSAGPSSFSRPR